MTASTGAGPYTSLVGVVKAQWKTSAGVEVAHLAGVNNTGGSFLSGRAKPVPGNSDSSYVRFGATTTNSFNQGVSDDAQMTVSAGGGANSNAEFICYAQGNQTYYARLIMGQNSAGPASINFERGAGGAPIGLDVYAGSYLAYSDAAIKDKIEDESRGLERTRMLKPRRFTVLGVDVPTVGLVAQEVQAAFPEAVRVGRLGANAGKPDTPDTERLAIDLGQLVTLGIAADLELDERIDALTARLDKLEPALLTAALTP